MPEIRDKLVHVTDSKSERITDVSADASEIFHNISGPVSDLKSCCVRWVLTEKHLSHDLQPMRDQETWQRGDLRAVLDHRIRNHSFGSRQGSCSAFLDLRNGGKFGQTTTGYHFHSCSRDVSAA